MSIAVLCGLIILVLLVIMLIAGVPIAVALAVSSVCAILPIMDFDVALLTGAQRDVYKRQMQFQFTYQLTLSSATLFWRLLCIKTISACIPIKKS